MTQHPYFGLPASRSYWIKVANVGETDLVVDIALDFPSTGVITAISLGTSALSSTYQRLWRNLN